MSRLWLAIGAINILLGLIFGALGAHALTEGPSAAYATSVNHQLLQGLGLVFMGLALDRHPQRRIWDWAAALLCAGILAFSGGIYLKSLTALTSLGPVVPVGGALMMLAWLLFAIGALSSN